MIHFASNRMGCCRFLLLSSMILLHASLHVEASRSSISESPLRVKSSSLQSDGFTDSKTSRKLLEHQSRPWWQLSQKLLARQMGSKPPNCDDKCNYCNPCEAVEVPISNKEVKKVKEFAAATHEKVTTLADPDDTNYMPESWRCACGDEYYNP